MKMPKREPMALLYRLISGFAGLFFRLLYRNVAHYAEKPPEGGAILASNHVSFYDPPLIAGNFPQEVHFLASDYLFKVPLLGPIIRAVNAHPIARGTGDIGAFRLCVDLLKAGKKVVVFPEGTRSHSGELKEFKRGVAKLVAASQTAVIPIYIAGAYEIWGKSHRWPKLFGKTRIFFGKALYWDDYKGMDRRAAEEQLTADLREAIINLRPR